jgi:hypothetical protein
MWGQLYIKFSVTLVYNTAQSEDRSYIPSLSTFGAQKCTVLINMET